jgi:hypothetical protein
MVTFKHHVRVLESGMRYKHQEWRRASEATKSKYSFICLNRHPSGCCSILKISTDERKAASVHVAPMQSKGKALGTLTIGSSSPNAFAGCAHLLLTSNHKRGPIRCLILTSAAHRHMHAILSFNGICNLLLLSVLQEMG